MPRRVRDQVFDVVDFLEEMVGVYRFAFCRVRSPGDVLIGLTLIFLLPLIASMSLVDNLRLSGRRGRDPDRDRQI